MVYKDYLRSLPFLKIARTIDTLWDEPVAAVKVRVLELDAQVLRIGPVKLRFQSLSQKKVSASVITQLLRSLRASSKKFSFSSLTATFKARNSSVWVDPGRVHTFL